MSKKIQFTQKQLDQMIQMHSEGMLNREIAAYFHTSPSTINRRLAEQNVQSRHPSLSQEREEKVIQLYKKIKD